MPMPTLTHTAPHLTRVAVDPCSPAGEHHRAGRLRSARAAGFAAHPGLNLHRYPGRTIERLTYTNVYLGGHAVWAADDVKRIDQALAAALRDPHLNNVIAQYYPDGKPTTTFKPSRVLDAHPPQRAYKNDVASLITALEGANGLAGFDLSSTVFCFMLPRGVVLSDHASAAHAEQRDAHDEAPVFNPALGEERDTIDSLHGLGGYHGSIHRTHGGKRTTVYYAVGVYAEGSNGIAAFDKPWKSICATFYHELCEARTDPDIEDAIAAGDTPEGDAFLGWYSPKGGEIGDMPMDAAGAHLERVMKEVPLSDGSGRVPVQLMWSNAAGGPEGPIAQPHPYAGGH